VDEGSEGPLAGIVVVDLSRALAGPHATMMLGDLGAHVVKVENPAGGDDTRGWGPPFVGDGDERESTYFLSANRNKLSVTADLKTDAGRRLLERLIVQADVLVENFRTGVLDRLGFTSERLRELNPRLVVLSITGFGHDGPASDRSGYDQIAQGEAGLMTLNGATADEPLKVGVPIADLLAGMNGAFGVVSALLERERTGVGRVVRTSLFASVVGVHAYQGTRYTVAGETARSGGNRHPSICPYGLFHCADGIVQIAVGSEGLWRSFAAEFGFDADAVGFADNRQRVANADEVNERIESAFVGLPKAELMARLASAGIPSGEVRTLDQVYEWEQTRSQGLLLEVDHSTLGAITLPGPSLRFDDQRHAGGRTKNLPPPVLGEHDQDVLDWLAARESAD
jgi:crotonobetainyl-CoA:carnitine CoA-transferase CaiB-like acyl-CoA transferase